ncbi:MULTISPECIES: DUF3515 domain-containing protein [unclassified Streptomyces]|uniref:DUF3515 domain-containing protein n=1 Tax=Streptomyces lonegramiae TaxID=3075524 RepID=A0ABU2XN05_9ACTN|nr:DUF3515 domain-containing protein [Streptomyces sp. DSM 41529]MDT0547311.1 DUF3515 domain-containing protein [Streptomyces sp. DSM 41529]
MNCAHRSPRRRAVTTPAAVALLVLSAAGCSLVGDTDGSLSLSVPKPTAEAARLCRALHKELPKTLEGLKRRTPEPASDLTAAWGDPAIKLRCGVAKPLKLTPGTEHYDPYVNSAEVNGVKWLPEQLDDGYRFTTVLRRAYVEVTVPGKYAPEVNPLVDLASAVEKSVPEGVV